MIKFLIFLSVCRKVEMLFVWKGSEMIRLSESIKKDQKEIHYFLTILRIIAIQELSMEQNLNSYRLFLKMDWRLLDQVGLSRGKDILLQLQFSKALKIGLKQYLSLLARFMLDMKLMLKELCLTIGNTVVWLNLLLERVHTHPIYQLL